MPVIDRFDPINEGCVGIYDLRDGSIIVPDLTGLNPSGFLTGVTGIPVPFVTEYGNSLLFNNSTGIQAQVQMPMNTFTAPPLTVMGWFSVYNIASYITIVGGNTTFKPTLLLSGASTGANQAQLGYQWEGSADEYNMASGLVVQNTLTSNPTYWYLAALTVTSTVGTVWLGSYQPPGAGLLQSATNVKTHNSYTINNPMTLGNDRGTGTHYMTGWMLGGRIYKRALTQIDMERLFIDPWAGLLYPKDRVASMVKTPPAGGGPTTHPINLPIMGAGLLGGAAAGVGVRVLQSLRANRTGTRRSLMSTLVGR